MSIRVHRATANLVVLGSEGPFRVERVAIEAGGRLVEVEMTAVIQTKVGAPASTKGRFALP